MAALEGGLTFQKGLGAVHSLSHALGALKELRLHHGTLNAVLLPAVLRFNQSGRAGEIRRVATDHGPCARRTTRDLHRRVERTPGNAEAPRAIWACRRKCFPASRLRLSPTTRRRRTRARSPRRLSCARFSTGYVMCTPRSETPSLVPPCRLSPPLPPLCSKAGLCSSPVGRAGSVLPAPARSGISAHGGRDRRNRGGAGARVRGGRQCGDRCSSVLDVRDAAGHRRPDRNASINWRSW